MLAVASPRPGYAQGLDAWLDAVVAHAPPPGSAEFSAAHVFGLVGGRVRLDPGGPHGLELAVSAGRGADSEGPAWLQGSAGGEVGAGTPALAYRLRGEVFGVSYLTAYDYRVGGFALRPRAVLSFGRSALTVEAQAARGRWYYEAVEERRGGPPFRPPTEDRVAVDGPLAITGARLEVARSVGPVWLQVRGEGYRAENGVVDGNFAGGGADVSFQLGFADAVVGASLWSTPAGTEAAYQLLLALPVGPRASAFASGGRVATDPLYGTGAGTTSTFGASVRLTPDAAAEAVFAVGDPTPAGRRVTFRLRAPRAEEAAVAGDFSGWEAWAMAREGDVWVLQTVLEPGLYHFSFIVDGDRWFVPDHAPGVTTDGWGQRNATIVIEDVR